MLNFERLNYGEDAVFNLPQNCYEYQITIVSGNGPSKKWLHKWVVPFDVYMKWTWYFKYRFCLAQIATPKTSVRLQLYVRKRDPEDISKVLEKRRADAILGKRRQITQIENQMEKAKAQWVSLFPIEDDPLWKKARLKLEMKKCELKELLKSEENT